MPKPRVQRGRKEHEPKKNKQGGEKDKERMGHAKLAAPQSQQPTHLLQAGEGYAEVAGEKGGVVLGEDNHLRAYVRHKLNSALPSMGQG